MRARRFFAEDSGQTVIVAALAMTIIIAFLGLAVDVGHLRLVRRNLQTAADAAALAGALEVRICGGVANCPAMQTAAKNALVENGLTVASANVTTSCPIPTTAPLSMMISNPTCVNGAKDPNAGRLNYVEVVLSEQVKTRFARIVGFNNVPVSVRAEAARGISGPCIYALDPTASGAISIVAGVGVRSTCAIVAESNSPSAVTCLVGLLLSAPKILVTGGTAGLLCGSNPPATIGVPVRNPPDPLGYLPAPDNGSTPCGKSTGSPYTGSSSAVTILLGGNVVFNPGVYCGGISITAALASNITFTPGVYVLRQATNILGITTGGLNITLSLLSTINGQGVMFYNEGAQGSLSVTAPAVLGLSNFNLTAPATGTYAGVLFFQAHGVTASGTFVANLLSGSSLTGAIYLPDALATYGVGGINSTYNILVAKDIQFNVNILTTVGSNYAALQSGSPLGGDTSVLVQ
jgi:Flp pilus assembly protein TadG